MFRTIKRTIRRSALLVILCTSLSVQTTQAMVMDSEGIQTSYGNMSWEELIDLKDKVNLLLATTAIIAGYIIYKEWKEYSAKGVDNTSSR